MTPLEVAQKCFEKFSQLTMNMSDDDRCSAAEELEATLEGVYMARDAKRIEDDAY
jgi:hypothetical protein